MAVSNERLEQLLDDLEMSALSLRATEFASTTILAADVYDLVEICKELWVVRKEKEKKAP